MTRAQAISSLSLTDAGLKLLKRCIDLEARFGVGHELTLSSTKAAATLFKHHYMEVDHVGRGGVAVYRISETGRAAVETFRRLTSGLR